MNLKEHRILSGFLWLVALHSFLVGIGLIVLPSSAFEFFGYEQTFDRFFSSQGGVFHIAMAVCYGLAGYDKIRYKSLILFTIVVKLMATVFLASYYLFVSSQWLIIISCLSDLSMGLIVFYLYRVLFREKYFNQALP